MKHLLNRIFKEDCITGMDKIPDKSIDMILCDLPYGTTNCKWDEILPLDKLWEQYKRIIKPKGVIALTAAQPFTTTLIESNKSWYRYNWYWIKNTTTGFAFARYQPLRCVEDICIFYRQHGTYNPQGLREIEKKVVKTRTEKKDSIYKSDSLSKKYEVLYTNYPRNTIMIKSQRGFHPTQKPEELFEYLIKTYTNKGETVLDNCMGSGTTAIACINTKRNYIGFETDKEYFEKSQVRIKERQKLT